MTTNNDVKAPRPCTLPWSITFDFNQFKFCSLRGGLNRNDTLQRVYVKLKNGDTLYSPYYTEEQAWEVYNQVIQAIASAQRPWLKTEGFEFCEAIPYYFLRENGTFEMLSIWNDEFHPCDSTGVPIDSDDCSEWWEAEYRDNYTLSDFVAFKPVSDSQEAWKVVAGVEAYKGVV